MKYVIVGGVAGGATTAARLRRLDEDADIVIFEKGAHISYANCGLPYYIGDTIKERKQLFLQTPESLQCGCPRQYRGGGHRPPEQACACAQRSHAERV